MISSGAKRAVFFFSLGIVRFVLHFSVTPGHGLSVRSKLKAVIGFG